MDSISEALRVRFFRDLTQLTYDLSLKCRLMFEAEAVAHNFGPEVGRLLHGLLVVMMSPVHQEYYDQKAIMRAIDSQPGVLERPKDFDDLAYSCEQVYMTYMGYIKEYTAALKKEYFDL